MAVQPYVRPETQRGAGEVPASERRGRAWILGRGRAGLGPLMIVAAAVGLLSLLLPSTPTYDPWSWIIWGREIVHLELVTDGGPSWKPLPVLFTAPFALAGDDAAPSLWLAVARAGGALALLLAFRLAWRLAGRGPSGVVAGFLAALGILGMSRWLGAVALGNSEGLLIALVLAAFDRHLDGRRDHAFLFGAGAALLRPEIWPFLFVYGVVLWRKERSRWRLIVIAGVLVVALWFLPEWWGSGQLLRSSDRANDPLAGSIAFADRPALEVLRLAGRLAVVPLYVGALIALGAAAVAFRRQRAEGAVLALGLATCAWTGLIMLMTEAGYSGNRRYLMLAGACICILGGVGFARLGPAVARRVERATGRVRVAGVAGALASVGALALALPGVEPRVGETARAVRALGSQAEATPQLERLVTRLGGPAAVLRCGRPTSGIFQRPIMAWTLGVHARDVAFMLAPGAPGLVFRKRYVRRVDPVLPRTGYRPVSELGRWEVFSAGCR